MFLKWLNHKEFFSDFGHSAMINYGKVKVQCDQLINFFLTCRAISDKSWYTKRVLSSHWALLSLVAANNELCLYLHTVFTCASALRRNVWNANQKGTCDQCKLNQLVNHFIHLLWWCQMEHLIRLWYKLLML